MKLEEIAKMAIDEVAMELKQMSAAQENLGASEAENGSNLTGVPASSGDVNLINAAGLANLVSEISVDEASEFEAVLESAANLQNVAPEFDGVEEIAATVAPQKAFEVEVTNFTGEEIYYEIGRASCRERV